jgi:hypothetical protein
LLIVLLADILGTEWITGGGALVASSVTTALHGNVQELFTGNDSFMAAEMVRRAACGSGRRKTTKTIQHVGSWSLHIGNPIDN